MCRLSSLVGDPTKQICQIGKAHSPSTKETNEACEGRRSQETASPSSISCQEEECCSSRDVQSAPKSQRDPESQPTRGEWFQTPNRENETLSSDVMIPTQDNLESLDRGQPQDEDGSVQGPSCVDMHARLVGHLHDWLTERMLVPIMVRAARYPFTCIAIILFISMTLSLSAYLTDSFRVETDRNYLLPNDAYPKVQQDWIDRTFTTSRYTSILLHAFGDNMLTEQGALRAWSIHQMLVDIRNKTDVCTVNGTLPIPCPLTSVANFWSSAEDFQNVLEDKGEDGILEAMSSWQFADGTPVSRSAIFGRLKADENERVQHATSFRAVLALPVDHPGTPEIELELVSTTLSLREEWKGDGFVLEIFNLEGLLDEINKPIEKDLPLLYASFANMMVYAAVVLTRCRKNAKGQWLVSSNGILGCCATITVILSLITGYSFCALTGQPVTTTIQLLPFVLVGIGLDDTFILLGAYRQTERENGVEQKIRQMAQIAGPSIFVTTLTDVTAFGFGGLSSSVPTIRICAFFAIVCIVTDFFFQITFFIAFLVLDQRRMDAERRDYFLCCKARNRDDEVAPSERDVESLTPSFTANLVHAYSTWLLHPTSKKAVVIFFSVLLALGAVAATHSRVAFPLSLLTPSESYIDRFHDADRYFFADEGGGIDGSVYLHGMDFASDWVRESVDHFVSELEHCGHISASPSNFWLDHFRSYVDGQGDSFASMSFQEQLNAFLDVETYHRLHAKDIIRELNNGTLLASRVKVNIPVDIFDTTKEQVELLVGQRAITLKQPINKNMSQGLVPMFLSAPSFEMYEHYRRLPGELRTALVFNIMAVFLIMLFFLPHPFGALLSLSVVAAVTVELLGIISATGRDINTLSAITLILSTGLVVDFGAHVIHSYLHCPREFCSNRDERVTYTLSQVGFPVLLGGLSTFLGVLVLVFAKGEVFRTFFVMMVAMVSLGLSHGLVFVPVALAIAGPAQSNTRSRKRIGIAVLAASKKLRLRLKTFGMPRVSDTETVDGDERREEDKSDNPDDEEYSC